MEIAGIEYEKPTVVLLQDSGIGVAEYAARTCYDSFDNSENNIVKIVNEYVENASGCAQVTKDSLNDVGSSSLLDSLAWVHHHHSIIEHATLSYLIKGTSRGVLQEHARHRIQAISVRSTRYTMTDVVNAFVAAYQAENFSLASAKSIFYEALKKLDMFVVKSPEYIKIETNAIYDKMRLQLQVLGSEEFYKISLSKENIEKVQSFLANNININNIDQLLVDLGNGKKKRNVGDAFKHVVSDNWKVDMVVTFNLRSLKNYFDLRLSNSAWFQINWLAEEMVKTTPKKYLNLILKEEKINKYLS